MGEEDAAITEEAAADAFSLVGNEHRVAILRALLDAHADPELPYPTPFAQLRERAGVDVSPQFAYHLDELVDSFVAKTGDGYRLRYAGWKAAAALAAGTYTRHPAFGPTPISGSCPHCNTGAESTDGTANRPRDGTPQLATDGAALHASYGDAWLTITCHGCERTLTRYPFPPGAAAERLDAAVGENHPGEPGRQSDVDGEDPDRDALSSLLEAFDRRVRSHFALAVDGVCPECAGRMHTSLQSVEEDAVNDTRGDGYALQAVADCDRCGNHVTLPVGVTLLDDPAVTAWCATHELSLDDRPFWELPVVATDAVRRTHSDPLEATVTIQRGDSVQIDDETDADTATTDTAATDTPAGDERTTGESVGVVVTANLDVHLVDDT